MQPPPAITDTAVQAAFDAAPAPSRNGLLKLRALIYATAADLPQVGPLTECLKWGQPAYLTQQSKSGSTLRIGVLKAGGFALFAHCQTSIIRDYAAAFPGLDRIDGNRAVQFETADQIVPERLRLLIRHGLTYHL